MPWECSGASPSQGSVQKVDGIKMTDDFRLWMLVGSLVLNCLLLLFVIRLMDDRKDLRIDNKVLRTDSEHYRMTLSKAGL